jgi:hypothetical protein
MGLLLKWKLSRLDKKIMSELKRSQWYRENESRDKMSMSLRDFDSSETMIQLIKRFAEVVWKQKQYRSLLDEAGLVQKDIEDIFLLMTIVTMPNPVMKTGPSGKMSATLVASAMYQEIEKQFKTCLAELGRYNNEQEQEQFGHRYASDVMSFAVNLKCVHGSAWGPIKLSETIP